MQPGYICVAGIEEGTARHVRAVTPGARMFSALAGVMGGCFEIGALVDLGETRPCGTPPETEDVAFSAWSAEKIRDLPPGELWRVLQSVAAGNLEKLFGKDLERAGRTFAVPEGHGATSLGCLTPESRTVLRSWENKIRLEVHYRGEPVSLSVTDLRLYHVADYQPDRDVVERTARRLRRGAPVLLSVGLTRPWRKEGDFAARHWLQVNNLHFEDNRL